jgi:hypothetical protein
LVISARFLQIRFPLLGGQLDGGEKDIARFSGVGVHSIASTVSIRQCVILRR